MKKQNMQKMFMAVMAGFLAVMMILPIVANIFVH